MSWYFGYTFALYKEALDHTLKDLQLDYVFSHPGLIQARFVPGPLSSCFGVSGIRSQMLSGPDPNGSKWEY